jgi:hypothetical protein
MFEARITVRSERSSAFISGQANSFLWVARERKFKGMADA